MSEKDDKIYNGLKRVLDEYAMEIEAQIKETQTPVYNQDDSKMVIGQINKVEINFRCTKTSVNKDNDNNDKE